MSERRLFATLPQSVVDTEPPRNQLLPEPRNAQPVEVPDAFPAVLVRSWRHLRRLTPEAVRAALARAVETEFDRGIVFLLVPVLLGVGVVAYHSAVAEPSVHQLAAITALAGTATVLARGRLKTQLLFAAFLVCAIGAFAAKLETVRAGTKVIGAPVATQITGRVLSLEHMASGRVRLTLGVIGTERPRLRYAPDIVRISARAMPVGATVGALVTGYAQLLPPSGPVRPGGYDVSFESYFDGIGASGFFLGNPAVADPGEASFGLRLSAFLENARNSIADRIRASIGGVEGEIAAALIVGVRAGIPDAVNESMRRTGIYHIISISGLHMALVAGTVMGLLRGAFALLPDFSSRRPVKKYAAALALLATGVYLLISGMVVAAERSFIMLAVMLLAVMFDRRALSMRNLAISAVVVILITPHEVIGPSFQMSFAATAALVGGYAAWADRRADRLAPRRRVGPVAFLTRRLLGAGAGLAATSLLAGGATTLFAVWHFQRVAPLSLVANLAVMPIVSVLVMPFAVFAALAMPFGVEAPFLFVMGRGLTAMIAVSDWLSARSPLDAVGLVSGQSVAWVTAALVVACMATTWLRIAAVPFALAGVLTLGDVRTPDLLVSEDGRLLAMPIGGERLAVNRQRPNAFTIDNWKRAIDAELLVPPEIGPDKWPLADTGEWQGGSPFFCKDGLCLARHPSGAVVAQADTADAAATACAVAALIVIADATVTDPCDDPSIAVVTLRDLARRGAAVAFFDATRPHTRPDVQFALTQPYRPWHDQRRFSREARGMPPREAASR